MRVAPQVTIPATDQEQLEKWSRGHKTPSQLKMRARIVLLAAEGLQNRQIASKLGIVEDTASKWRGRYIDQGLVGIQHDAPRPGRPRETPEELETRIVEATLTPPLNRSNNGIVTKSSLGSWKRSMPVPIPIWIFT